MKKRIPFFVFILFYLVFSIWTYRDYGCTWDEKDVYTGGLDIRNYLLHYFHFFRTSDPAGLWDPEHSYPYAGLLVSLIPRMDFSFFHLVNLLFGLLIFAGIFEILLLRYQKGLLALCGPLFLFLTLSFTGSLPANPKDIPFAIFYFLSLAFIYIFEEKFLRSHFRWIFLGLLFGLTMSSRIVGFTLLPILISFDFFAYGSRPESQGLRSKEFDAWLIRKGMDWIGVIVLSQWVCRALWPYLGRNYLQHLVNVFWFGSNFPQKVSFLFMGGFSDSLSYPWYYLPVWIALTTPLFVLLFFIVSFFLLRIGRNNRLYALLAMAFLFNLGLYFGLHPAIYDGLRHFLFLVPILTTLAAIGFIEVFEKHSWTNGDKSLFALTLINGLLVVVQLVRLHPYEYIYFNELAGGVKGAYGKFETDYWAASLPEAVEWLESHETTDPWKIYKVYAEGNAYQSRTFFTPNIEPVLKPEEADYCLLMNRAGGKPRPGDKNKVIHVVEREGVPLTFILKMR